MSPYSSAFFLFPFLSQVYLDNVNTCTMASILKEIGLYETITYSNCLKILILLLSSSVFIMDSGLSCILSYQYCVSCDTLLLVLYLFPLALLFLV